MGLFDLFKKGSRQSSSQKEEPGVLKSSSVNNSAPKTMKCDICSAQGSFRAVGSDTVRIAAGKGFNPFQLGIAAGLSEALSMGMSKEDMFQRWKTTVDSDISDWNVCPNCYGKMEEILSKESIPDASGSTTCKKCQKEMTETTVSYQTKVNDNGQMKQIVVMDTPALRCDQCNTTTITEAIEKRIINKITKQKSFALCNMWNFSVIE